MSGKIRFSLMVQTSSGGDEHPAFVNAEVQVWEGDEFVETVKLIDFQRHDLPAAVDADILENYATAVARTVARKLADVQLAAVDAETLHLASQYKAAGSK